VAMPRFDLAIDALGRMNPTDVETCVRLGDALFRLGAYDKARARLEVVIRERASDISVFTRAEVLSRIGECERRAGRLDEALTRLKEALSLEPSRAEALESLARVHEARESWTDLHAVRTQQLDLTMDERRFDLLVSLGDLRLEKLGDRAGATSAYVQALDLQPDDRRLLAKLMQVYSDERDWAKLVEVVHRLAEGVSDDRQKAKYLYTAAIVSARQLGEPARAADYFEQAIDLDGTLDKALREATELRRQIGDHMGRKRLLEKQLSRAKELEDRTMIVSILDELAELYDVQLHDDELAIEAYETAMAFDAEDRRRVEALVALYGKDPKRHASKAAEIIGRLIAKNPYRVEPYRSLRRLYAEGGNADGAFLLAQALTVLNQAEPEEEELFRAQRPGAPITLSRALTEDAWTDRLAHPDLDVVVTRIFATIEPVIVANRAQALSALGFDPAMAATLDGHGNPLAQALRYGLGVYGIEAPLVFENLQDAGAVGIVASNPPALVVGRAAFDHELSPQLLAFIAGRSLTFMKPGFFARRVAATGTALRAWLLASIRLVVPSFPVALDMDASVDEAFSLLRDQLPTTARAKLESLVTRLLQSGRTLDVRRWAQAVDLTADRASFLLANDLEAAIEAIGSVEDIDGLSQKDRVKELVVFSVSEDYLAIRREFASTGA
jgi:tetratricopeptide (TPR) repeat protein